MFTGIISAIGTVAGVETRESGKRFIIEAPYDPVSIDLGASIAHDGCCLTVTTLGKVGEGARYTIDASTETLALTTLDDWTEGTRINLERALKIGDELGGHIVTGHVDGVATVVERKDLDDTSHFTIEAPTALAKFIATKGSVALQGTSLTVNSVEGSRFTLMLIPHTLDVTMWGEVKAGDKLNIEIDMMARYAARLAEAG